MGYFCCFGGEIRENKNNNKNGPKNKSKIIMHYNLCLILSRHNLCFYGFSHLFVVSRTCLSSIFCLQKLTIQPNLSEKEYSFVLDRSREWSAPSQLLRSILAETHGVSQRRSSLH